jgi:L-ascorbate metabolism protein UlaG (beta-lactamase superfamily)
MSNLRTGSASSVWCRWLGVAGIELQAEDRVLAIDPFFTRPPLRRLLTGHVSPDRALIARHLARCDYVLVTHPHWDHFLDVPEVVLATGATAFGSPNACRLLSVLGVPERRARRIEAGERLTLGPFRVEVLPGDHGRTPIDWLINGRLAPSLRPPLRLRDYKMDRCFSFLIEAGGLRVRHLAGPARPADVLTLVPAPGGGRSLALVDAVGPRVVIPLHWDNLFRPLSRGLRPALPAPIRALPPFRQMDPRRLKGLIERRAPATRVLLPTLFTPYDLRLAASRDP